MTDASFASTRVRPLARVAIALYFRGLGGLFIVASPENYAILAAAGNGAKGPGALPPERRRALPDAPGVQTECTDLWIASNGLATAGRASVIIWWKN